MGTALFTPAHVALLVLIVLLVLARSLATSRLAHSSGGLPRAFAARHPIGARERVPAP